MNWDFYDQLNDPGYFRENRLDAHSDHVAYAPEDSGEWIFSCNTDACAADHESSFRKSLNGRWQFYYSPCPSDSPKGFEQPDYDTGNWDQINVPDHIQLQGFDTPQYVNMQYPWDGREELQPGEAPKEFNPTAHYCTVFTIPERFRDKRVFLSFQGVESCFRMWLNGKYIGFSSDTFTPSEFELTDYLQQGENKLAVQVYKWYCGSWLEDQDFFRFSGIFRDVYLYAVPQHHVMDVKIEGDYDPSAPEKGWIRAGFTCLEGGAILKTQLLSPDGILLAEKQAKVPEPEEGLQGGFFQNLEFDIVDPVLWSAEQPALYLLKTQVMDGSGKEEEWFIQRIGIRHFQMDENVMKLNGRRVVFKGVNRHEFSADHGRVTSEKELLTDLLTMKRNNINAIRLCHYPNSSRIYELADLLGFYLVDECNMETHGTWDMVERGLRPEEYALPSDHREYLDLLLDRLHSMYQRDKNHPSILIWSLGNESFGGSVIHEMSREIKRLDPSRLVHYEGIFHDRRYPDTSDMESQMYSSVKMIRDFLTDHTDKPFICCEYMHAMGNSCGALYKYTDLTDENRLYQGGFIWDYIDQAIRRKDRYGQEYMTYGGDHGDRPNDGCFSGNGLVDANREPTPKLAEVKYCYQNILARFAEGFGRENWYFTVINKQLFSDTGVFLCVVLLEREGIKIRETQLDPDVPALSERQYEIPFELPEEPGEYGLTVSFRLKKDMPWAKAGYEIAFSQHVFNIPEPEGCREDCGKNLVPEPLRVIHGDYNIGIRGAGFDILFSKLYGGLISYRMQSGASVASQYSSKGYELLAGMVRPNFWRAPVDNDNGNMMPFCCAQWKAASLYLDHKNLSDLSSFVRLENPEVLEEKDCVRVIYTYYLPTVPIHSCKVIYKIYPDGTIETTLEYEPPEDHIYPEFPEFSMMLKLDADYDQLEWYGLGPSDNYPDRKCGARLGIFRSDVKSTVTRYLVPQETGNHEEVRWMKVTDKNGRGLLFDCNHLAVSVSPYSPHELENALHPTELAPAHFTYVRIGRQRGLGGDDSWGSQPHDEFRISSREPQKITFRFRAIDQKDGEE